VTSRSACTLAVRLIGLLIAGLSFSDAWQAFHTTFFNRIWFSQYFAWLWPFSNYDADALNDAGRLVQFAFALFLLFGARLVARLLMRGIRTAGECPRCGYDISGVSGPACPECGTPIPARPPPIH
jgi:hypothetical protein